MVRVTISSGEWLSYTNQPGGFGDTRKASASSSEIKFTVDNIPPSVLLLSPKNQTYNTAVIPLDFTSNETLSEANYILDGQTSSPINGNTTLQNIAEGQHSLYLRIVDAAGNTKLIEKVQFTVADLPKPTPITQTPNATDSSNGQLTPTNSAVAPQSGTADQLPSGTLWVIVGAVVVIVVVATALVYLRKRGLKA